MGVNKNEPPKVMTWGKALPVFATAVMFDLVRIFFEQFWFFGPALAGLYCTAKGGGGAIVTTVCGAGAAAVGTVAFGLLESFGVIMAMAAGFVSFLTLGLWILMTNARILKANATGSLWFVGGFGVSIIPIIGTIPIFSIVLWRLYRTQIKVEKAALKKFEKGQASEQLQIQRQQTMQRAQIQAAHEAQFMEQEAVNDAMYGQAQAANDERYDYEQAAHDIPKGVRKAA